MITWTLYNKQSLMVFAELPQFERNKLNNIYVVVQFLITETSETRNYEYLAFINATFKEKVYSLSTVVK